MGEGGRGKVEGSEMGEGGRGWEGGKSEEDQSGQRRMAWKEGESKARKVGRKEVGRELEWEGGERKREQVVREDVRWELGGEVLGEGGVYLSLHHEGSFDPQLADELVHIQCILLSLHPLQHAVQRHERACAPHPRTAVHQQRRSTVLMGLAHTLDELDEAGLVCRHAMVRPGREMKVCDLQWSGSFCLGL